MYRRRWRDDIDGLAITITAICILFFAVAVGRGLGILLTSN